MTTSSMVDVGEDHRDSAVDRLRRVLDARDAATWNFDFRTSTPLPGRYDWSRSSGAAVEVTLVGRAAERSSAGVAAVRRGRLPSTLRHSTARRRLVFDEEDLAAADRAVTGFLLRRLVPSQRRPVTPERTCLPEICSTSSMPLSVETFSNDERHHRKTASSDAEDVRVQISSSTDRRATTSPTVKKRKRSTCENRPLRVTKITGTPKHAATVAKYSVVFCNKLTNCCHEIIGLQSGPGPAHAVCER